MIEEQFEFSPCSKTGTYELAKGGTEMMYERLISSLPKELLNKFQIICSRVRELDPNKKKILWVHDTYDDPENIHLKNPENHDLYEKFVFVTYSQFLTYHMEYKIPYSKSVVIENAIQPFNSINKPTDRINLIYHTTPHRGLELLVPTFEYLAKKYSDIHLDVFSNFDIYGWPKRNEPYEKVFEVCRNNPQITYHGTQPNAIVRDYLSRAHIFAYPSIWPETSCIAAMEAMAANCLVVASDLGALPETLLDQRYMYRYDEDPHAHIRTFVSVLEHAIIQCRETKSSFTDVSNIANVKFDWGRKSQEWKILLESLL